MLPPPNMVDRLYIRCRAIAVNPEPTFGTKNILTCHVKDNDAEYDKQEYAHRSPESPERPANVVQELHNFVTRRPSTVDLFLISIAKW